MAVSKHERGDYGKKLRQAEHPIDRKGLGGAQRKPKQPSFDETFTFLGMYRSYKKCKRNVGWKGSTQRYSFKALRENYRTLTKLRRGKYKPKKLYCFYRTERAKPRFIRSNHISDRVVQKSLCDYFLVALLRSKLIYDNSATLKKRGCDFCKRRMKAHIEQFVRENPKTWEEAVAITMDFHSYFENIDHGILLDMLREIIEDDMLYALTALLILEFGEKGLGLGSQVSQICAVFYRHPIDDCIKHRLKVKHFSAYMDDAIALFNSKQEAKDALAAIIEASKAMKIEMNGKKTQIIPLSQGVPYLQRRFAYRRDETRTASFPNRSSEKRMRRKMRTFARKGKFSEMDTSYRTWKSHLIGDDAQGIIARSDAFYGTLMKSNEKEAIANA